MSNPLTNAEIMDRVAAWQASALVHPLTCGADSGHQPLVAVESAGAVVLRCLECPYQQDWIPSAVLRGLSSR